MRIRLLLAALLGLFALPAAAQTWPDKPVKIVVPFGPGGPADVYARSIGQVGSKPSPAHVPRAKDVLGPRRTAYFQALVLAGDGDRRLARNIGGQLGLNRRILAGDGEVDRHLAGGGARAGLDRDGQVLALVRLDDERGDFLGVVAFLEGRGEAGRRLSGSCGERAGAE